MIAILFFIFSLIMICVKWGLWGLLIIVIWLCIPNYRNIKSTAVAVLKYLYNVFVWVLGCIAVALLWGNTWGAVMAILIGVNEIFSWNKN